MTEQDYKTRNSSTTGYWRDRVKKAAAERDEALAKLKEQREWSDQYRDCMWAEHERAEKALAQVAVLMKACVTKWNRFGIPVITCTICGIHSDHDSDCPLSNLPAATKEMLNERDALKGEVERLRTLIPTCACTDERTCDYHMEEHRQAKAALSQDD